MSNFQKKKIIGACLIFFILIISSILFSKPVNANCTERGNLPLCETESNNGMMCEFLNACDKSCLVNSSNSNRNFRCWDQFNGEAVSCCACRKNVWTSCQNGMQRCATVEIPGSTDCAGVTNDCNDGTPDRPCSNPPEGWHDGREGIESRAGWCVANGWVRDPDSTSTKLDIKILIDGHDSQITAKADISRSDLASANVCSNGACAFQVDLYNNVLMTHDVAHTIIIQAKDANTGTWINLRGTGKSLTCNTLAGVASPTPTNTPTPSVTGGATPTVRPTITPRLDATQTLAPMRSPTPTPRSTPIPSCSCLTDKKCSTTCKDSTNSSLSAFACETNSNCSNTYARTIGDVNGDGKVCLFDYSYLQSAFFGQKNNDRQAKLRADFNGNGLIDDQDRTIFINNYHPNLCEQNLNGQ